MNSHIKDSKKLLGMIDELISTLVHCRAIISGMPLGSKRGRPKGSKNKSSQKKAKTPTAK